MDENIEKLTELLEQNQFELLFPENDEENAAEQGKIPGQKREIRLVYLMNDAAESFLVFENVRMRGEYRADYEGEIAASLSREEREYVLAVHQGETVITLFFENLRFEAKLYDYGEIGHFWVKDYEYLRQLEYRIAILRDKYEYLGEEFGSPAEQKLAALADFPPLNYCCYPAVPEKYVVFRENPWSPTEEAIAAMRELAVSVKDRRLVKMLDFYRRHPGKVTAKMIAGMLHRNAHAEVIDLLNERLREAAEEYPRRTFGEEEEKQLHRMMEQAKRRQKELEDRGRKAVILREEPFAAARDSIEIKVYLMVWKCGILNRKVEIEEISYR